MAGVAVRALAVATLVVAASGCAGSGREARTAPAPPVSALTAPAPALLRRLIALETGMPVKGSRTSGVDQICLTRVGGKQKTCSAAETAKAARQFRAWQAALRPALGETPETIAALRLAGGRRIVLVAWWTRTGALCLETGDASTSGGTSGAFGPCLGAAARASGQKQSPSYACDAICLHSSHTRSGYLLAGTVAPSATALAVTDSRGATTTYPLTGPRVPHGSSRVFMASLSAHDWRRLSLRRGSTVLASRIMPRAQAAIEDCEEQYGDHGAKLEGCMSAATGSTFPP
ncbi:MAG TPA: hypothetical protein VFJ91_11010 [Gaiellaceae bacterium]|nr:hypothetical protein [Gaiellaceae bacterium]